MDVAHGGRWHFGFFMEPDVPEMLIAGHETEFFPWWFRSQGGSADSLPAEAVATYRDAYTGRDALRAGFGHYRTLLDDGTVNDSWAKAGGRLPMPVLAVGGDRSAGSHLAASLRDVAPILTASVVQGAGHFVVEQQPERFLGELDQFLGLHAHR